MDAFGDEAARNDEEEGEKERREFLLEDKSEWQRQYRSRPLPERRYG